MPDSAPLGRRGLRADVARAGRPSAPLLPLGFVLLLSGAIVPVLLYRIPAMVDYPNHLGRMYAIADLARDPLLARYYLVRWHLIPNLAMDLIVPPLARYTNIFVASNAFLLVTMLLMVTGPFAIQAALFRRLSVWPLIGFLFVYNGVFTFGFTNFLFGVGLALWAIAAWIALREAHWAPRLLVGLLFALALFITHLHTLGLYGLTILCYELWRWRHHEAAPWPRVAGDVAVFAAPFLVCLALLGASATGGYAAVNEWTLAGKFHGVSFVVKAYSRWFAVGFGIAIIALVAWAWRRRQLEPHPVLWYILPASIAVFLLMPFKLFGSSFADSRLPVAIVFIAIGMVRWQARRPATTVLFCCAVGALALARFAEVDLVWHHFAAVYADFERSFQAITPGSKILTTQVHEGDGPPSTDYATLFTHIPALAMAERSSLFSLAFTDPGKQVLLTRPEFRDMVAYEGWPPRIDYVVAGKIDEGATAAPVTNPGYYLRWRDTYDYVYVLFARAGTPAPAPELSLVYQGADFQLYKVAHTPPEER